MTAVVELVAGTRTLDTMMVPSINLFIWGYAVVLWILALLSRGTPRATTALNKDYLALVSKVRLSVDKRFNRVPPRASRPA